MQLVLSLFSGIGLLDKAFREKGFCVVSAGDIIYGQDIRDFTGLKNKFDGIIGGSPCQDFSLANRDRPVKENSYGFEMLEEFIRIVTECEPKWALLENVPQVPNVSVPGYYHQRIDINQAWFEDVYRLRHIQHFSKSLVTLQIDRSVIVRSRKLQSCALASDDRSFKELCRLQGLEDGFDLPSFNVRGKKRAVGNGVPLSMGRVIAKAVKDVTVPGQKNICDAPAQEKCLCGCGRNVTKQRAKYYDFSCRKRAQRNREKQLKPCEE